MNKLIPSEDKFSQKKEYSKVPWNEKVQTIANSISSIASLIMIFFIALQTQSMNKNIKEIERGFDLESHATIQNHKQRINQILFEDDTGIAKNTFDLEKKDVLAYIIINDYESLFDMRCEELIGDSSWKEIERIIYDTMNSNTIRVFWEQNNPKIGMNFKRYVNNLSAGRGSNFDQERQFCPQSR